MNRVIITWRDTFRRWWWGRQRVCMQLTNYGIRDERQTSDETTICSTCIHNIPYAYELSLAVIEWLHLFLAQFTHSINRATTSGTKHNARASRDLWACRCIRQSDVPAREGARDRERWGFHVRSLYPALPNWLMAHVPLFLMIFHSVCARKDARILIPADAPATMEFQIHASATTEFRTSQECCLMLSQKQCKTNMSPV